MEVDYDSVKLLGGDQSLLDITSQLIQNKTADIFGEYISDSKD